MGEEASSQYAFCILRRLEIGNLNFIATNFKTIHNLFFVNQGFEKGNQENFKFSRQRIDRRRVVKT